MKDAGQGPAPASHARSLVVWGVPGAIGAGEEFRIRVGIKCDNGCRPAGWVLEVRDHADTRVAAVEPEAAPTPGTEALFAAAIELTAPIAVGRHEWSVHAAEAAPAAGGMPAHAAADSRFAVTVVPVPDCRVTVVATDRTTQSPVPGARVVAHPYRSVTDGAGVARLAVPKGAYRLFVSGNGFLPLRVERELAGDATIRVELEPDVGPSDAEMWP